MLPNKKFKLIIQDYYKKHGRDFPWRRTRDPYKIMVSEVMLQQTQTARVVPKYQAWIKQFPTTAAVAKASLTDVLRAWQGLGYNRRALALKKASSAIEKDCGGTFPKNYEEILKLPGIGPYTAGAIMAFAYNKPVPIIETNIRTVFIHFFFTKKKIRDKDILLLVEKTLDTKNPRDWYHALMDYGVMLKQTHGNLSRKSAHYARQTTFKGSNREIRAAIIRAVTKGANSLPKLSAYLETSNIKAAKSQILKNCRRLATEGFLRKISSVSYIIKE